MKICEKLETCERVVSPFVYWKACTGNFRPHYCPEILERRWKTPKEWKEAQERGLKF